MRLNMKILYSLIVAKSYDRIRIRKIFPKNQLPKYTNILLIFFLFICYCGPTLSNNKKLFEAVKEGKTEIVSTILNPYLKHLSYLLNSQDNRGETALMWSAHNGHLEILKILLNTGANINIKDDDDCTA